MDDRIDLFDFEAAARESLPPMAGDIHSAHHLRNRLPLTAERCGGPSLKEATCALLG